MKYGVILSCILLGLAGCGDSSEKNNNKGGDPQTPPPQSTQAPKVELGPDQQSWNHNSVTITANVTLYTEGTAKYQWQQISGPKVNLAHTDTASVTINGDTLTQDSDIGLSLTVTDSRNKTGVDKLILTLKDQISAALNQGDASLIYGLEDKVIDRGLALIEQYRNDNRRILHTIYQGNAITYDSGPQSQMIQMPFGANGYPEIQSVELVRGNAGRIFAAASDIKGQRNAAFGTDILTSMQNGGNLNYQDNMKQILSWLLNQDATQTAEAKAIRLFLMGNNTANRINAWFATHYPNWTVSQCSVEAELSTCLGEAALIVTGSSELFSDTQVSQQLAQLQAKKTPLLYMHLHAWNNVPLTKTVLGVMGFAMQGPGGPGNYFSPDKANWQSYTDMFDAKPALTNEELWLTLFKNATPPFTLANCATNCDTLFNEQYKTALNDIRTAITHFDTNGLDIFSRPDYTFYKYLILLGDAYRKTIRYPMDVATTDSMTFLKAYFADHTVYHVRDINPVPQDLGNFSRTDFSHVTISDQHVNLMSKQGFRSAGVYALPGQTVTVTRTDNSPLNTWVFINTQRPGSTHEFDKNSYNRAKYLQSPHIKVEPGQTIAFTSPYGGPIQIQFNANDLPSQFSFKQIGHHPYWRKGMDGNVFLRALASGDYDWAELATEHFEVHSQLEKMQKTMSDEARWDTAEKMNQAIMTYMHNYPHVLAGFKGPFIDTVSEITDFATTKGWQMDNLDIVKHMNADQATCGWGCSGNPYDAGWSFGPTAHGDVHEFGHGLEKSRLRFDGRDPHSSTNPYSYYTKSRAYTETGKPPECQSLTIKNEFTLLQQSVNQTDPFTFMNNAKLNSWSQGMGIMLQSMVAAQKQDALQNGWHLLARLHILLREYNRAQQSEQAWTLKRNNLGMGNYTLSQAKAMSNNDFLMIAMSYSTALDYRDFYQMWGLATTNAAKTQVASFNYPTVPKLVYVYEPGAYCYGLNLQAVAVDGKQTWPLP